MKRMIIIGGLLFAASAFAGNASPVCTGSGMINGTKIFGSADCESGTVSSLSVFGKAYLRGTTVTNDLTVKGRVEAKNLSVGGSTSIFGRANLDNTKFKGDVEVHGKFYGDNLSVAGSTTVFGVLDAEDSSFAKTVTTYGPILADNSDFKQAITMHSTYAKFDDSKATSITVQESAGDSNFKVYLSGNTTVTGDISFVGPEQGKVYVGSKVKFTGKVINGSVKK